MFSQKAALNLIVLPIFLAVLVFLVREDGSLEGRKGGRTAWRMREWRSCATNVPGSTKLDTVAPIGSEFWFC